jgi:hypothetical protein
MDTTTVLYVCVDGVRDGVRDTVGTLAHRPTM